MSEANVETAKRVLDAVGAEEYDAALALLHPHVELFPPGQQAPLKGAYSVRRWMQPDAFAEQVINPLDFMDAGDQKVLGRQHIRARGAGSGIELEITSWSVWTFDEEGLVIRIQIFLPHEESKARRAAGLSE
jgi:hypothetical protein